MANQRRAAVALWLSLTVADSAGAYEPDVEIRVVDRYTIGVSNQDAVPVDVVFPSGEVVTLDPGEEAMRRRRPIQRARELEVRVSAASMAGLVDALAAKAEAEQRAIADLMREELAWGETLPDRETRVVEGHREALQVILGVQAVAACFDEAAFREARGADLFGACITMQGVDATHVLLGVAELQVGLSLLKGERSRPDFAAAIGEREAARDAALARLTAFTGTARAVEADGDEGGALPVDGQGLAAAAPLEPSTTQVRLPALRFPRLEVTPYATLAFGIVPFKGVPGGDWVHGGGVGWHAEVAAALMPELLLGGKEVAGFLRLMATGGLETTWVTEPDGSFFDDDAHRLSFTSLTVGAQLRTTIHPYAYFDLGSGLEIPLWSNESRVTGGEVRDIGGLTFEPWTARMAGKVWGQVRCAVNLIPRRGLDHRSAGPAVYVATRVRQWPGTTSSTVDDLPSAGALFPDFRVGITLNL